MGRLIDESKAYEVLTDYYHHTTDTQHAALKEALGRVETVDAVPVVRCGECRYWDRFPSCSATPQYHACRRRIMGNVHTMREDFCSQGERKGGDNGKNP